MCICRLPSAYVRSNRCDVYIHLVMFRFSVLYDSRKIIEYPGFNVPVGEGTIDVSIIFRQCSFLLVDVA